MRLGRPGQHGACLPGSPARVGFLALPDVVAIVAVAYDLPRGRDYRLWSPEPGEGGVLGLSAVTSPD
jgi:hypothetical protein